MRIIDAKVGNIVRVKELRSDHGLLAAPEHLEHRREGLMGRISSTRGVEENGHVGHVWVQHKEHQTIFWSYELELVGVPEPAVY